MKYRLEPWIFYLFFGALVLSAQPEKTDRALTVNDLELLLEFRVPPDRILSLVRERCLAFSPLEGDTLSRLAKSGAGTPLQGELVDFRCTPPPEVPPPPPPPTQAVCPVEYTTKLTTRGCLPFRKAAGYDQPTPSGQCTLDLFVDGTIDILIRGRLVLYEVAQGAPPVDVRSACTQPAPAYAFNPSIGTELRPRGKVEAIEQPTASNQFTYRLRISDTPNGASAYRVIVAWANGKLPQEPPPLPPGITPATEKNPKDGLEYQLIPAGTFRMGCSPADVQCGADEKPDHQVEISTPFWLSRTETTVAAYSRFAAQNGRNVPPQGAANLNDSAVASLPVVNVTWNDASDYCLWAGGRLPTEAEWEYAARAGEFRAQPANLNSMVWYGLNSENRLQRVGTKTENAFGLHDMLGNALEWLQDWYASDGYARSVPKDPIGAASGTERVTRGASYSMRRPESFRFSARDKNRPGAFYPNLGFRCVWKK
jgi:formylglycine-generating enzyme required for sulfatase activity